MAQKYMCELCKQMKDSKELLSGEFIFDPIEDLIKKDVPDWSEDKFICRTHVRQYRTKYLENMIKSEEGELSKLSEDVIQSLKHHDVITKNLTKQFEGKETIAQKVADKVASFGGSWYFITFFFVFLFGWMIFNILDPYPYTFLNVILSCLAALQGPIIMMSQNRMEAKDRLRSESDFQTNLKAELEIRHINAKLDQLIHHQWKRMMEIQRMQLELLDHQK